MKTESLLSHLGQESDSLAESANMPVGPRLHLALLEKLERAHPHSYPGTIGLGFGIEDNVGEFYYRHGDTPERHQDVVEAISTYWANHGLPTRTDYSITDKTGILNAKEAEIHRRWFESICYALPTQDERTATALLTIEKACESFTKGLSQHWPPSPKACDKFLSVIVRTKIVFGIDAESFSQKTNQLMHDALPALIYSSQLSAIFRHFGKVIENQNELITDAAKIALKRTLQLDRLNLDYWNNPSDYEYGPIKVMLDIQKAYKIEVTSEQQELVLRHMRNNINMPIERFQELKDNFQIETESAKEAIVEGIVEIINRFEFDPLYAHSYQWQLQAIGAILKKHDIAPAELNLNHHEILKKILPLSNVPLIDAYFKTTLMPIEIIHQTGLSDDFTKAIENYLIAQFDSRSKQAPNSEMKVLIEDWTNKQLQQLVWKAIKNVGNQILAERSEDQFYNFSQQLGVEYDSKFTKLFQEGARALIGNEIAKLNLKTAGKIASRFEIDHKTENFQMSGLAGIVKIFTSAADGKWDYNKFKEILELTKLKLPLDNQEIKDAARHLIVFHAQQGSLEATNHLGWLLKNLSFNSLQEGEDLRQAAILGIKNCIILGNEFGLSLLCNKLSKDLTTKDISQLVLDQWQTKEGQQKILENLRRLPEAVLNDLNRDLLLYDYQKDLGVAGPLTYGHYIKLKKEGRRIEFNDYIKQVHQEKRELISSKAQNLSVLTANPRYKELCLTVFQNNWDQDANFTVTEACLDRSADIEKFILPKNITIRLAENPKMQLKQNEQLESNAIERIDSFCQSILDKISKFGTKPQRLLKGVLENAGIENTNQILKENSFHSKVFERLLSLNKDKNSNKSLEELIIANCLASLNEPREFFARMQERIASSDNSDYTQLIELENLFADHLTESLKELVDQALRSPESLAKAQDFYTQINQSQSQSKHEEIINKARPEKLGLSKSFLTQIRKALPKVNALEYSDEHLKTIVTAIEELIIDPSSDNFKTLDFDQSLIKNITAVVNSQRSRTLAFLAELGVEFSNKQKLAEIDLSQHLKFKQTDFVIAEDQNQLKSFIVDYFYEKISEYTLILKTELNKFEADKNTSSTSKITEINAVITKNHSSAHARKTAGVCISIDNPELENPSTKSIWNLPEFFQIVLQEQEKMRCVGAVFLHYYEDLKDGKTNRILTASFNPSSTFLYQVDQQELFKKLLTFIEEFAWKNKIDKICVSNQRYVVTNRTAGEFEAAINQAIAEVNENYKLFRRQPFSIKPEYWNDELRVIWNRPKLYELIRTKLTDKINRFIAKWL